MPYSFTLPTTSVLNFTLFLSSSSHPSLPLTATTHRNVLRSALKRHKRLSSSQQPSNLSDILSALQSYIPYLIALNSGLSRKPILSESKHDPEEVDIVLLREVESTWRCPLTAPSIPGRDPPRIKLKSLEAETLLTLSTLAAVYCLLARTTLRPLYDVTSAGGAPSTEQRTTALSAATKYLIEARGVYAYMLERSTDLSSHSSSVSTTPAADITHSTIAALEALTAAEATLTAVSKDDPYAAAVAQERNVNDKEWMYKAPTISKVRASLFGRCCVKAGEYASTAGASVLGQSRGGGFGSKAVVEGLARLRVGEKDADEGGSGGRQAKLDGDFVDYVDDLHRTSRARACRFLAIDAEMAGETGTGIAWLNGALSILSSGSDRGGSSSSGVNENKRGFSRLKKEWTERREDKKAAKEGGDWGSDAGRAEEGRIIESLKARWTKMNDTMNTQPIPAHTTLLTNAVPSGRDYIPEFKTYIPPSLDVSTLVSMRAPPDPDEVERSRRDGNEGGDSSDDDVRLRVGASKEPVGAFPGTASAYSGSATGGAVGGSGGVGYY